MNTKESAETTGVEHLYTIGTVSQLTGVPAITLRAWERRYELIHPDRKASGHRLYSQHQIDLINRITSLTARGVRLSQIQPAMLESKASDDAATDSETDIWSKHIDSMIGAIIAFDELRLEEIYNEMLALYPIEVVTDRLLRPLLVELGRRWESAEGSVSEEHFFAFYLRNKLGARYHHRSRSAEGPLLLIASLPGEYHEIGLLIFSLAAHAAGYRLLNLGTSMPLEELPGVVAKSGCDAIVLSGAVTSIEGQLSESLALLVSQLTVPVFVGGESSVIHCDTINKAGATALGSDVGRGLKQLKHLLQSSDHEA